MLISNYMQARMKKIDITTWKKFQVGKLFDILNGKGITKNEIYDHQGTLPAIQSGEEKFGLIGFLDYDYCVEQKYTISKGACLTVARSGSSGYVGYQPAQCVVGDSAKILEPKFEANKERLLFLRSILMVNKAKYAYSDKVTRESYSQDEIFLPVSSNDLPDWQYMDAYMQQMERQVQKRFALLFDASNNNALTKIDTKSWKRFHLYDDNLFTIDAGTKLDKIKMTNDSPSVNFVGRANANNGVTDFIDKIEGLEPYKAGCLTISLGGEYLGSCFIQEKPFYTSQNVNVLIPKHEMSDYCKRFISTMIFREGRLRYKAFIDELNRHMKTDFSILLPVSNDNRPDWNYMEDYMRKIDNKTKTYVSQMISTLQNQN